jgi:hypothetical protein
MFKVVKIKRVFGIPTVMRALKVKEKNVTLTV